MYTIRYMDNVVCIPSDTWIMWYVMKYLGIVVCCTIKYIGNVGMGKELS